MIARRAVLALASARGIPRKARWLLLRAAGVHTDAWNIAPGCQFTGSRVTIGRGTFINGGCVFDSSASITIGERCALGLEVMLLSSSHEIGPADRRAGAMTGAPVTVGDGCWIGSRAVLLPGATVGDGAVIAAGAVVRGDCDPHTLYAGVPAKPLRALPVVG